MKQFLNDNVTRCNNIHCTKRNGCKRFIQYKIDIAQGYYPKSTVNFKEENCEKIIKLK